MHSRLGPGNPDENSMTPTRRHDWKVGKAKCRSSLPKRQNLLGIYPEKTKVQKDTCAPMFIAALFPLGRTWKQPKCPSVDEWIKIGTYIQWNITQSLKGMKLGHL